MKRLVLPLGPTGHTAAAGHAAGGVIPLLLLLGCLQGHQAYTRYKRLQHAVQLVQRAYRSYLGSSTVRFTRRCERGRVDRGASLLGVSAVSLL